MLQGSLEFKINQVFLDHSQYYVEPIQDWLWTSEPNSLMLPPAPYRILRIVYAEVDLLIQNAPINEALTSPLEYVRECRKWYAQRF